jgi:hypothetical protein
MPRNGYLEHKTSLIGMLAVSNLDFLTKSRLMNKSYDRASTATEKAAAAGTLVWPFFVGSLSEFCM